MNSSNGVKNKALKLNNEIVCAGVNLITHNARDIEQEKRRNFRGRVFVFGNYKQKSLVVLLFFFFFRFN